MTSTGASVHTFNIDALGISVDLSPGATESIAIDATPGRYEFSRDIPGHAPAGMVGILVVE